MNHETLSSNGSATAHSNGIHPIDTSGPGPELMCASTLTGNDVYNHKGEDLGDVTDFMLDTRNGRVAYAVLSFGGFLGMGDKLFAVPFNALKLDTVNKRFTLDVEKSRLESAPGFDKTSWPNMADSTWANSIHAYYGTRPYPANDLL
jgi:sporulation protein YlmC with PRC-barrel domain